MSCLVGRKNAGRKVAVAAITDDGNDQAVRVRAGNLDGRGNSAAPELQMAPGDYIVIDVTDDGHGIDESILPRIFDPFFTTKGKETGTGLGLANSYSIVEQHAGTITVESTPGRGSTFSVYLPRARQSAGIADTETVTPSG